MVEHEVSKIEANMEERYKKTSVKIMSFVHLFIGVIAVIAEITKISASSKHEGQTILSMGEGFYCGCIFLVAGFVGLLSVAATSPSSIKAFMILSIISSVFGGWLLLVSGCIIHGPISYGHEPAILIHGVLILCGLTELILGIVSSCFGCRASCSCCQTDSENIGGKAVLFRTPMDNIEVKKTGSVGGNVRELNDFDKQANSTKATINNVDISTNVGQMVAKTQGYARFP